MSYDYKINIISPDATSGSMDRVRSLNGGGYWETQTDPDTGNSYLEFISAETSPSAQHEMLNYVLYNTTFRERISNEKILPNWTMPVRLAGNPERIENDHFWKAFLIGGTHGVHSLPGIFNRSSSINHDHSFEYKIPWPYIQSVNFPEHNLDNLIKIQSEYSFHLPEYEEFAASTNEKLLFNIYAWASTYLATVLVGTFGAEQVIDPDILNFVTREGQVDLRDTTPSDLENIDDLNLYYQTLHTASLSSSTEDAIQQKFRHIIFDEDAFRSLSGHGAETGAGIGSADVLGFVNGLTSRPDSNNKLGSMLASSINFEIPFYTPGPAAQEIMNNNLSAKFMKTLKESFSNEIDDLLPPLVQSYPMKQEYATFDDNIAENKHASGKTVIRSLDYVDMLTYIYDNFLATNSINNYTFMNFQNWKDKATFDSEGAYRYSNTADVYSTIYDLVKNSKTRYSLSDSGDIKYFIDSLKELYNGANSDKKFVDTLAYRIEKIGGPPAGTNRVQNVLQEYWIFNGADADALEDEISNNFNFYDTQVKYDTQYTYNIYAYVLVGGLKYRYSDLRVTRKIGETTYAKSPGSTLERDYNCLEFYDPRTGETATQLLADTDELAEYNELVTNAQITDQERYLADFNLSYEPTYKIMEIPLFTKTLSVLDNPGNSIRVEPFYLKDQSQTVGFKLSYDVFSPQKLPFPITATDFRYNVEYMIAHDLLVASSVTKPPVAKQRYLEIYRTTQPPASYIDFNGNLLRTVDLAKTDEGVKYSSSMMCFYDKIATNTKYYYAFRILTEQRAPSYISPIYQTELVSNGGYLYAEFNALYGEDLKQDAFVNPFKKMKQLLFLLPNMSHLMLDTETLDYNETADSQLDKLGVGDAENLIWGKTFKIRLTSKKTGKKIDLNVTYNLNSE